MLFGGLHVKQLLDKFGLHLWSYKSFDVSLQDFLREFHWELRHVSLTSKVMYFETGRHKLACRNARDWDD